MPGATRQEKRYDIAPMLVSRTKHRSPSDHIECVIVAEAVNIGSGIEQRAHDFRVSASRCPMKGICIVAGFARVRIGPVGEQELHDLDVPSLSGGMKTGPPLLVRGANERRMLFDEFAHGPSFAIRARIEKTVSIRHVQPIDFGLQGTPTREPVLSCDGELRCGQPGLRIGFSEFAQTFSCDFFQVVDRGTFGEL
jgi:hypothetical protein